MIVTFLASLALFLGLGLSALLLFAKLRGVLHYWIRPFHGRGFWALGRTIPKSADPAEIQAVLAEASGTARSQELHTSKVIREWNDERDELFLGVVLPEKPDSTDWQNFELRHFPARDLLRISGLNRADESTPLSAARKHARENKLRPDFARPMLLSGQSFRLYQWNLPESAENIPRNKWRDLLEWLAQVRDNLSLPILLAIITIGLLGMRDPLLFAIGIGLIVFLSGACKFVLIHQNRDEADEIPLQNY